MSPAFPQFIKFPLPSGFCPFTLAVRIQGKGHDRQTDVWGRPAAGQEENVVENYRHAW